MRSCPRCFSPYFTAVSFCGLDGTAIQDDKSDPLIGTSFGHIRILDLIGCGTLARVYKAYDAVANKPRVVKFFAGEISSDEALLGQFKRRLQENGAFEHPNISSILELACTAEGATLLISELIIGRDLKTRLQRKEPLGLELTANVIRKVATGLAHAHQLGIAHRDLKPSNIMIAESPGPGDVKILDLGIASALDRAGEGRRHPLDSAHGFLGVPHYAAPEQIMGLELSPQTDLYALGACLFEMLEGHAPFVGETEAELRHKHLYAQPPSPRPARGLESLALRLLAKSPRDRPASASEVVMAIDALFANDDLWDRVTTERVRLPQLELERTTLSEGDDAADQGRTPLAATVRVRANDADDPSLRERLRGEPELTARVKPSTTSLQPPKASAQAGTALASINLVSVRVPLQPSRQEEETRNTTLPPEIVAANAGDGAETMTPTPLLSLEDALHSRPAPVDDWPSDGEPEPARALSKRFPLAMAVVVAMGLLAASFWPKDSAETTTTIVATPPAQRPVSVSPEVRSPSAMLVTNPRPMSRAPKASEVERLVAAPGASTSTRARGSRGDAADEAARSSSVTAARSSFMHGRAVESDSGQKPSRRERKSEVEPMRRRSRAKRVERTVPSESAPVELEF